MGKSKLESVIVNEISKEDRESENVHKRINGEKRNY